jgi:hypothetical protein
MSSIPGQDVAISSRNFLVRFTGQQSDQFVYVNVQAHVCIHTRVSTRVCTCAHIKFRNHVSTRTHTLNNTPNIHTSFRFLDTSSGDLFVLLASAFT